MLARKLLSTDGDMSQIAVAAFQDDDASVPVAESDGVPGLITKADTLQGCGVLDFSLAVQADAIEQAKRQLEHQIAV